jgi:hypothetical protein
VTLRPGDLVGLPAFFESPADHVALRYVLLALALACAALAARGRRRLLVFAAIAFVEAVLVFWASALGRPYGLFVDAAVTRAAAEASAARLPGPDGALSGEPRPETLPVRLVQGGVGPRVVIAGPSLLPLLVVPALGLLVFALWPRAQSAEAAVLWLAFSTSEAATLRGEGFLAGLWSHPGPSLALAPVFAAVLGVGRLRSRRLAVAIATLAVLALALLPTRGPAPPLGDRLLTATFEQGPWLLLGAYGLAHGAPVAAWTLLAGGGMLYLLGPAAADAWATEAVYRAGLILASTAPLLALTREAGRYLFPARVCHAVGSEPERIGFALLLAVTLPGSFIARWNPAALDPLMAASQIPLSTNLEPGLAWLRAHTPENATCAASPDYAALVAVAGGRRVLRAPDLWQPADDQRRRRVERMLAEGREAELLRRYQIGCLFLASGDQGWQDLRSRNALDGIPGFDVGYRDRYVTVYRVSPDLVAP